MNCQKCGDEQNIDNKYCSNCSSPIAITEESSAEIVNSLKWYETGWVWFWLLLVWPIGVFGLVMRAKPEHRLWWAGGIVGLFLFTFIVELPDGDTSAPVSNGTFAQETDSFGATYNFFVRDGNYYYSIKHRDGSGGTYPLQKSGNRYTDIESRFGEYFVVDSSSIKVYNSNGFIRKL